MSAQDPPEAEYAAEDPSDTIQSKRIEAIFSARQRVVEQKRFARDGVVFGEFGKSTKNEIIRDAVEDYIRELLWLIEAHQEKTGEEYLEGVYLGEFTGPTGEQVQFCGLLDVLNAPRPFEFTIREQTESHLRGVQINERTVTQHVPEHVLMNAFTVANEFCTEVGLDVRVQRAADPVFGFDEVGET
jgi:hypothetical protein